MSESKRQKIVIDHIEEAASCIRKIVFTSSPDSTVNERMNKLLNTIYEAKKIEYEYLSSIKASQEDDTTIISINLDEKDDVNKIATTDGNEPAPGMEHGKAGAPQPINPETGQHKAYFVLSEHERKKGYVRPFRRSYQHIVCQGVTTMAASIAETYARDPKFYGTTFCVSCEEHFPVSEFVWEYTKEIVGS